MTTEPANPAEPMAAPKNPNAWMRWAALIDRRGDATPLALAKPITRRTLWEHERKEGFTC